MSEQQAWTEFNEAMEGLKTVHTRDELETQKKKVWKAREKLVKVSGEFRQMLMQKESEAREKAERRRLQMELKTQVYMQKAGQARTRAEATRMGFPTVMKPLGGGAKIPLPDDDVEILVCPTCLTTNVNWLKVNRKTARKLKLPKGVREIPWCFRCRKRMVRMTRKEVNKKKREKKEAKLRMEK